MKEHKMRVRLEMKRIKDLKTDSIWVTGKRTQAEGFYLQDDVTVLLQIKGLGAEFVKCLKQNGVHTMQNVTSLTDAKLLALSESHPLTLRRDKLDMAVSAAKQAQQGAYVSKCVDHRRATNPHKSLHGGETDTYECGLRDNAWEMQMEARLRKAGHVCVTQLGKPPHPPLLHLTQHAWHPALVKQVHCGAGQWDSGCQPCHH